MEEKQITIDGTRYLMHNPFMVLATQNPIEQEGTYRLPEAQLDRFMFKIDMKYPNLEEEIEILNRENQGMLMDNLDQIQPVLNAEEIMNFHKKAKTIRVEKSILDYIAKIVLDTRINKSLYLGASPRASLALLNGSKAYAAIQGRDFVTPDDIRFLAPYIIKHRVMVHPEREIEGLDAEKIIQQIIQKTEVPR
jgi:MoxR-like ATPase